MKNIILTLLISFFTASALAKTEVIYVNGASEEWPEKQAELFYKKMKANGIAKNESVDFAYYPIPQSDIQGIDIGSALGIACQREISRESFPTPNTRPNAAELDQYYKTLGRMYDDMWITALKNPSCNGILIYKMYGSVLGLANALKTKIDKKVTVVLASYSMGNNYAEAAIAYLYHKGYIKNISDIKLVGIGSPAFTSSGTYINASLDSAVYDKLYKPYSLPATVNYCVDLCSSAATDQEIIAAGGMDGHRLFRDYLNDNLFTLEHKKKVSEVIAQRINELTEIAPTPSITDLTFTPATANTAAKLTALFSTDMQSGYSTTGAYVPKAGKEGYWPDARTFVIEFSSVTSGGQITLVASGFKSVSGQPMAADRVYTFPGQPTQNLLLGAPVTDSCIGCTDSYNGALQNITDGNLETARNIARYSGTFHIFLDSPKTISLLKLLPSMNPNGLVNYEIQTSTDPRGAIGTWTSHGGVKSSQWANNTWFDFTLNTNTQNVRVIKVNVTSTPSWLAFFEIEGYAQ